MSDDEFFCLVSAAVQWGIPLPGGFVTDVPIDVGVFWPHRSPRGRGVHGRAVKHELATVVRHPVTGLMVTDPATTWAMLGAVLRHPYDLVAAGDAVVRTPRHPSDPPPLATVGDLAAAVEAGRRPGVVALRDALPHVRTGSASRPETWTRLTLVDGGLPEPELNWDVVEGGRWLARVDLGYPERRVALEYEGAHHLLDHAQWTADIERYDRLAAAGWRVIRVTKSDLFERPGRVVGRVRAALRARS